MIIYPFGAPRKLQTLCNRWYKRLRLHEWDLQVSSVDELNLHATRDGDGVVYANYVALPQYKEASIAFNDEMPDDASEETVFHELRHLHYSWVKLVFQQAWDGRYKMSRDQALSLLEDQIDSLIKDDWRIMRELFENGNGKG